MNDSININLKVYTDIMTGETKYAVVYDTLEAAMCHVIRAASHGPPEKAGRKSLLGKKKEQAPISRYIVELLGSDPAPKTVADFRRDGNKKYSLNYPASVWGMCATLLTKKGFIKAGSEDGKISYWLPKEG